MILNENQNENLNFVANFSQLISLFLLLKDASNNELMKKLNEQDEVYLKKIVDQNEELLNILRGKND